MEGLFSISTDLFLHSNDSLLLRVHCQFFKKLITRAEMVMVEH